MKPTVVILCGGRGTRLQEEAPVLPKPLVEIGGRPILWHVIQIYLVQGFRRFLLLTGYRREQIEEFVTREQWPSSAEISCLDTGEDTPTGGRLPEAWRRVQVSVSVARLVSRLDFRPDVVECPEWMAEGLVLGGT